jgi:hypothetical protein
LKSESSEGSFKPLSLMSRCLTITTSRRQRDTMGQKRERERERER